MLPKLRHQITDIRTQFYRYNSRPVNDHVTPKMLQAARDLIISADLVISELEIPRETVWELVKLCEQHSRPFALDISPLNRTDRIPESNKPSNKDKMAWVVGLKIGDNKKATRGSGIADDNTWHYIRVRC